MELNCIKSAATRTVSIAAAVVVLGGTVYAISKIALPIIIDVGVFLLAPGAINDLAGFAVSVAFGSLFAYLFS